MANSDTTMQPIASAKTHRAFEGVVLAVKDKTAAVRVETIHLHPKYHKQYATSKKYQVHDERGVSKVGDTVRFVECRPMSKTKRWRIASIVTPAQ